MSRLKHQEYHWRKKRKSLKSSWLKFHLKDPLTSTVTQKKRSNSSLFLTNLPLSIKNSQSSLKTKITLSQFRFPSMVNASTYQFTLLKKSIILISLFMNNSIDKGSYFTIDRQIRWKYNFSSPKISNLILNSIRLSDIFRVIASLKYGWSSDLIGLF